MKHPTIVGAGLAGLIAAHAFPRSSLVEAAPGPAQLHKALLRFRTDDVAKLTGIEFKPVTVRKAIWDGCDFIQPSIPAANAYSRKTTGRILPDRSIWNIDAARRWIAPDDFYARLIDSVGPRIAWGESFDFAQHKHPVVSTAPMPALAASLPVLGTDQLPMFERKAINVFRYHVEDCEAYQTVYNVSPRDPIYRSSITGSTLIVEATDWTTTADDVVGDIASMRHHVLSQSEITFGIPPERLIPIDDGKVHRQSFGKIAPIDEATRKRIILNLTTRHNVFSLGRFAVWKNILLDDVVGDIIVVKKLLSLGEYDIRRLAG